MSTENNSKDIPDNIVSDDLTENNSEDLNNEITEASTKPVKDLPHDSEKLTVEDLKILLETEKQKVEFSEDKIKHVLADYQNLNRKMQSDIENGVNAKIDEFILEFLKIYDDFVRAKEIFAQNMINTEGLDSILKNMVSLLKKYNVEPIDALGEIFDPNLHEAISVISDLQLDDNTITKEIRKGYISHTRVVRPSLVEISKKG